MTAAVQSDAKVKLCHKLHAAVTRAEGLEGQKYRGKKVWGDKDRERERQIEISVPFSKCDGTETFLGLSQARASKNA